MPGLLGKKIGMSRFHSPDGKVIPVTIIECPSNEIIQVKTPEKDGYEALVLGCSRYNRPTKNRQWRHIKEFRFTSPEKKKGETITLADFSAESKLTISGLTRGHGFQGTMKRHNFHGQPASHGCHNVHRAPGGISAGSAPARVPVGKKMSGHMGHARQTFRHRPIIKIDPEKNLLAIKGSVPGPTGSYLELHWED